ncbi:MAG: carbohydrate kinase family protein [Planctomycetes bacterium]|nr:carbohydrate kinase family protein [Planctomycetota bacterium]
MSQAASCAAAATALAAFPASRKPQVLVGFDGFIDNIIAVVAKRESATAFQAMETIAELGGRITAAAGKSANFELVVKNSKIGGNGPIMANALCSYDFSVTAIGLLGEGAIDPVFAPLAARATHTISLGAAASTDALEFSDGKVMLGKLLPLENVSYERLVAKLGLDGLKHALRSAQGIATVNWTMTLGMTEIWRRLAADVLPGLRGDRPLWFIDLADPAKRTAGDIRAALAALQELQRHVDVVLGMNEMELRQVLEVIGEPWPAVEPEWEAARAGCVIVRERFGLTWAMCHLVKSAACAWPTGSVGLNGFFEPKPMITTGAGDHFNAGFLAALLAGLEPAHALLVGGATSGYYVRTAVSPSRAQVIDFLRAQARA